MRALVKSSCVAASLAALALPACSDDGDAPDDEVLSGPLYLATSWVSDTETTNTYVTVFNTVDSGSIDYTNAIELPGYADAWVHGESVFVADGETPELTRYTLDAAGHLAKDVALNFSNYGNVSPTFYNNDILTDDVAYLSNPDQREYIVWNPTTMEITGTIAWPTMTFAEGLEPFHSYTDRGGSLVNGLYFHGVYGHNENWDGFGDKSYIVVTDTTTNTVVDTIEVPCPMMDVASVADDGYLYVSGWSYMPLSMGVGRSPTNCAARIQLATRTLDTPWTTTYPGITGGDEASGLRVVTDDTAVLAVFHGSGVAVTPGIDMWELDAGEDDWEIYEMNLATKQATATGVLFSDGSFYDTHVGDRYFAYLAKGDGTQVYERTATGTYETRFDSIGWLSRFFQLRE